MALQTTADLLTTTLVNVEPLKFTDISTTYQRFAALPNLIRKHKIVFDTGYDFRWDLMAAYNAGAKYVGMFNKDTISTPDTMTQGQAPWRHITWNWAIDDKEIAMNRSPRKIVDLALTRRIAALIGATVMFEKSFWGLLGSSNGLSPYGVPYWIVKNATEGFNGTVQSGFTTVGGINPTTYPAWTNWTGQYVAVTPDDFLQKLYHAVEFTDFDTAVPDMPTFNTGDDMGYYTNWSVKRPLEELLRNRNDNLGADIAKLQGELMVMQKPVMRVVELENDTTGVFYGINWAEFHCAALRNRWLKETKIAQLPGQHDVTAAFYDCGFQFFTRNRRRHFVLSTGTTTPSAP